MDIFERVGEATVNLIMRALKSAFRAVDVFIGKLRDFERRSVIPLLERRNISASDYFILKVQLSSVLFFLCSVLISFGLLPSKPFIPFVVLFFGYVVYGIKNMDRYFGGDGKAYREFFSVYLFISLQILLIMNYFPENRRYVYAAVFSVIATLLFSFIFRLRHGRDFSYGEVVEGGNIARVRLGFDLLSGVKPGVYPVLNTAGAKKGDRVKVSVQRGFLNLRGATPIEVIDVE